MSSGYQMVNAMADPGGITEIGFDGPNVVIRPGGTGRPQRVIVLDAAKREEFQRLFTEAERQAEANDGN